MKKEEKIGLSEAIRQNYRTEPLNVHLPTTVADRVFGKKTSPAVDAWLYVLAAACGLVMLVVCVLAIPKGSFSPVLLWFGLPVMACFWLSLKEMQILAAHGRDDEHRLSSGIHSHGKH